MNNQVEILDLHSLHHSKQWRNEANVPLPPDPTISSFYRRIWFLIATLLCLACTGLPALRPVSPAPSLQCRPFFPMDASCHIIQEYTHYTAESNKLLEKDSHNTLELKALFFQKDAQNKISGLYHSF